MAIRRQEPNYKAAAGGNQHLETSLRDIMYRVKTLEGNLGATAVSTARQAVVAPPPDRAGLSVSGASGTGRFTVILTNPEFLSPLPRGRRLRAPILHRIEYSSSPDFSGVVVKLPPTHQTYLTIFDAPSSTMHFRVSQSYDGISWNDATTHPAVTA